MVIATSIVSNMSAKTNSDFLNENQYTAIRENVKKFRTDGDYNQSTNSVTPEKCENQSKDFYEVQDVEFKFGIELYLNDEIKPFSGAIKSKYSDFQVFEIDETGNVVELKNETIPDDEFENNNDSSDFAEKDLNPSTSDRETAINMIEGYLSSDVSLLQLYEGVSSSKEIRTRPIESKEDRKTIHDTIRKHFGDKMISKTEDGHIILISATSNLNNSWKRRELGRSRKSPKKKFLEFTLLKMNKDTITALSYISSKVHLSQKIFTFAGTKDKRGITYQKVRAFNVHPKKLAPINHKARDIRIGDFEYVDSHLYLGALKGNKFSIVVRDVSGISKDDLNNNAKLLCKNGFINYFGTQRFGTRNIATYTVGIEILKNNWKKAFDLIMMPNDDDKIQVKKARQIWMETKDPSLALREFPKQCVPERSLLTFMKKQNDTVVSYNTLMATSRSLFLLYLHSYQSLVWNHVATKRLELSKTKVLIGDFVIPRNASLNCINLQEELRANVIDIIKIETSIDAEKYSIEDVVLPMPGHDIKYPQIAAKFYEEFMRKHGLDPYSMKRKTKECSLTGRYRHLISKVSNLSWDLVEYFDENQNLLSNPFDNEKLLPKTTPTEHIGTSDCLKQYDQKTAIIVHFCLEPSGYATMVIRELMKSSDLYGQHKKVNIHEKKPILITPSL